MVNKRRRVKIVSFNVAGIKNVLNYHPWNEEKTFEAMFSRLEADIVCFQETKIQIRDLTKSHALVEGYDSFFTAPKHKKGYSGVAIYVKKDIPVLKAEEGITGWLNSNPDDINSLPYKQSSSRIGGYPDEVPEHLAKLIDSEGRAVVLDLGWCVVIGLYCPANSTGDKSDFKDAFMNVLDLRVRNLVVNEKRQVVVLGDLNVSRELIDSAEAKQEYTKAGMVRNSSSMAEFKAVNNAVMEEWKGATVSRRIVNDWLGELSPESWKEGSEDGAEDGLESVSEEIDEIKNHDQDQYLDQKAEKDPDQTAELLDDTHDFLDKTESLKPDLEDDSLLVDTTRRFHPDRFAMYTCWNTKINARPGNFGSRLDYILVSKGLTCVSADILPELLGSDHCPIESVLEVDISLHEADNKPPRLSSKNLPQFRSSSIKDLFAAAVASSQQVSLRRTLDTADPVDSVASVERSKTNVRMNMETNMKRQPSNSSNSSQKSKRSKTFAKPDKQQSKLTAFIKKPEVNINHINNAIAIETQNIAELQSVQKERETKDRKEAEIRKETEMLRGFMIDTDDQRYTASHNKKTAEESWSKIFAPKKAPLCNHNLPCDLRVTKKTGLNQGRSFWVCSKPTASTESGSQDSRCSFFKWA